MRIMHLAAGAAVALVVTAGAAGAGPPTSGLDAHWLRQATRTDLYEIAGARIAATRATSPAVQELAATVERDHQRSLDRTAKLARQLHIGTGGNPTATEHWELHVLTTLTGAQFDHLYAWLEESRHVEAVADAQEEAALGSNRAVRALARSELPMLRTHLRLATAAKSPK